MQKIYLAFLLFFIEIKFCQTANAQTLDSCLIENIISDFSVESSFLVLKIQEPYGCYLILPNDKLYSFLYKRTHISREKYFKLMRDVYFSKDMNFNISTNRLKKLKEYYGYDIIYNPAIDTVNSYKNTKLVYYEKGRGKFVIGYISTGNPPVGFDYKNLFKIIFDFFNKQISVSACNPGGNLALKVKDCR